MKSNKWILGANLVLPACICMSAGLRKQTVLLAGVLFCDLLLRMPIYLCSSPLQTVTLLKPVLSITNILLGYKSLQTAEQGDSNCQHVY